MYIVRMDSITQGGINMKKVIALIMMVLMLLSCIPAGAKPDSQTRVIIGADISDVHAPYLTAGGGSSTTQFFTIDDIRSHPYTLINIWSNNCGYCLAEMPHFQQLHETVPEILMVGVCSLWISGSFSGEWNYFQQQGYTYMNVVQDSVLYNLYSQVTTPPSQSLPLSFLVNSDGIVVDYIEGALMEWSDLASWLAPYISSVSDRTCTVTFVESVNNTVLGTQEVAIGGSVTDYPTPPEIEGYNFASWRPADPGPVISDLTITAKYNPQSFKVRFYDSITGKIIKTKYVSYGQPVEPPTAPAHPGYVFVGWDHDLSCVMQAMDVYTIYREIGSGDIDGDGEVTAADALLALRAAMQISELTEEQAAEADVDGDGAVTASDALIILRQAMNIG